MAAVDLLKLLAKFRDHGNCDVEDKIYLTHVPFVAPQAYLNVVFKAAPAELRERRAKALQLPPALVEFYGVYNGADLLFAIRIFGFRPDGYLLYREDWFRKALPLDILETAEEYRSQLRGTNYLCFAGYSYDRSAVCIDRVSGEVVCFENESFDRIRQRWPSFGQWITSELARLSLLFDEDGHCLVASEKLLPAVERVS